ncbi:MAG: BamA/TamA family outer membrane protein [Proteobacteria bacterium]|nr:BamA/TamA family outer membrane protein [Pseudomonadota bacterium]
MSCPVAVVAATVALAWPAHGQPEQSPQPSNPAGLQTDDKSAERAAPQPALERREPPISWQTWDIGETLTDRERSTLRAFFAGQMRNRQPLTQEGREELTAFGRRIGYHLFDVAVRRQANGDNLAVLMLEPITLVRRVQVTVDNNLVEFYKFEAVFGDEITRRMRLRAGSALERDPVERRKQFELEAERIADYLRGEGYFDADVRITARPDSRRAVRLDVLIAKGTRYQIGRIDVVGNDNVPTGEIVERFRHGQLCVGSFCLLERFSRQNLNRDIQEVIELYHKRGYPAVRVRTDFHPGTSYDRRTKTVNFTVIINERRKISVVFEGNNPQRFSDESLEKLLTFNDEGSYDDVEVIASIEAIRRQYQSRGYFEADVTFERERFRVLERIVFTIVPGPRLRVKAITFEGNRALSERQLLQQIRTRPQRSSTLFSTPGYTTSDRLRQDAQRIAQLYHQKGFADAEITIQISRSNEVKDSTPALAALVAAGTQAEGLWIRFLIDEGERTRIDRIRFVDSSIPDAELRAQLSIQPGDPYHREQIERSMEALKRYFFEKAFPRAEISVEQVPGSRPNTVEIRYRIRENVQVRFGEILIQGNFKTNAWLIRDELGFDPGEPLSLGRVEEGQQNLRSSGLFNAVQVTPIDLEDGTGNRANLLVQVEERHDYRLGVEAATGFSTDRGVLVELGLVNANLFGTGLRVDLRGQYATQPDQIGDFLAPESDFLSLEGKLTAPRWITRRLTFGAFAPRLEATAFWRKKATERFGTLTSFGTSLSLSRQGRRGFLKDWLLSVRYDLRQRNRDEDFVRGAGPSDDIEQTKVRTITGALGPQILIDKRKDEAGRPNPLAPSKGFKLEFRALLANKYLLGDDNFIKLGVSAQNFVKLSRRLVASSGVRYDHGIPLEGVLLPEVERYFAGGDTTIRGFEEDRLATEIVESPVPPYNDVSQIQVLPAGGNLRLIHNLDLQIEVGELAGFPVASAIFLDTGLIENSLEDVRFTDLRHALGVALIRWVTPLSSLSLEWAIPLDPKPGDNPRGRYHLNLGLLF